MIAAWASIILEVGCVIQLKQTFLNNKVFHCTFSHSLTYMYIPRIMQESIHIQQQQLWSTYTKVSPMQMGRRQMDAAATSTAAL